MGLFLFGDKSRPRTIHEGNPHLETDEVQTISLLPDECCIKMEKYIPWKLDWCYSIEHFHVEMVRKNPADNKKESE